MSADLPITEYRFARGALRGSLLTLYPGRVVHDGGNSVEHMPLSHLAAVRVEFTREPQKLKWAVILVVLAVIFSAVSGPLQTLAANALTEVVEHVKREGAGGGVPGALRVSFQVLGQAAAALPTIGLALGAWALGLLAFYWWGLTTLTLTLGGVERDYTVRGRDPMLMSFVDTLGARLAELSG